MITRRSALRLAALPAFTAAAFQQKGLVIILIGPPASGKTTQAEKIQKAFGLAIISPKTMIKMSHDRKSDFNKKIKGKLADDEILGDEGMNGLLLQTLNRMDTTKGFILDGYPVTRGQADYLRDTLKQYNLQEPIVISLEIPEATLRQRVAGSSRAEDKPAVFDRRYENYKTESGFIRSYYPAASFHAVNAAGSPDDVFQQIRAQLEPHK
jgi:adenylate kinase